MKRFQALFQEALRPSEVLPDFFETALFGSCRDLRLSDAVRPMPQIRVNCGGSDSSLEDAHVDQKDWPLLLKDLDRHDSLCLKSPLYSASPDVLFVGNVHRSRYIDRFALALAARNFARTSAVNMGDTIKECNKFNVMFNHSDEDGNRLNILIICATQYGTGLEARFGERKFFTLEDISAWKYIDEVIVLDLCSRDNRARFFGLSLDDPLMAAVEGVISKHTILSLRL